MKLHQNDKVEDGAVVGVEGVQGHDTDLGQLEGGHSYRSRTLTIKNAIINFKIFPTHGDVLLANLQPSAQAFYYFGQRFINNSEMSHHNSMKN